MKVVSTDGLTKLIQLVKSAFVKVEDVVETSEVTLADVALSGDYDDLINKPSAVTEATVSGWGFTKNTGTVTSVNNVSPVNGNVTLSMPIVPTNVSAFTNDAGYITSSALTGYEQTSNKVTSISSSSTDTQYPSAKCVYDIVNGKADTNFSNVTQTAKNSAMLWGLPNLNSGISIAYNAAVPSNGYILFTGGEVTNNYMRGFINGVQVVQLGSSSYQNMERSGLIPVSQGDIISFDTATALFYPMKGTI